MTETQSHVEECQLLNPHAWVLFIMVCVESSHHNSSTGFIIKGNIPFYVTCQFFPVVVHIDSLSIVWAIVVHYKVDPSQFFKIVRRREWWCFKVIPIVSVQFGAETSNECPEQLISADWLESVYWLSSGGTSFSGNRWRGAFGNFMISRPSLSLNFQTMN